MIVSPQVPLHRLILSLSEALDHVHPKVADHQQRVAYIAASMARDMGFREQDLVDVFHAAALHDIGLIGVENRVKALHLGQLEQVDWHAEAGFELLRENPLFARPAEILRHHHVPWNDGHGTENHGRAVPLASHVLVLADAIEVAIDRHASILSQTKTLTEKVVSLSGKQFHPECVEAFRAVSRPEAFWLDITSPRIYAVLLKTIDWPVLHVDEIALRPIAEVFARIVDAASPWTAVHSAGVAATAVALAKHLNFSPREQHLMRAAGYLHDLGKLSVPTRILDKPDRLTPEEFNAMRAHTYHTFRLLDTIGGMPQISEWAAFHHERLDGSGYPFRHRAADLTLGSRIMAVADVFTALTEERPYRSGMSTERALEVLQKLADQGALDGEVIHSLARGQAEVDELRRNEQAEYGARQHELRNMMSGSRDLAEQQVG